MTCSCRLRRWCVRWLWHGHWRWGVSSFRNQRWWKEIALRIEVRISYGLLRKRGWQKGECISITCFAPSFVSYPIMRTEWHNSSVLRNRTTSVCEEWCVVTCVQSLGETTRKSEASSPDAILGMFYPVCIVVFDVLARLTQLLFVTHAETARSWGSWPLSSLQTENGGKVQEKGIYVFWVQNLSQACDDLF